MDLTGDAALAVGAVLDAMFKGVKYEAALVLSVGDEPTAAIANCANDARTLAFLDEAREIVHNTMAREAHTCEHGSLEDNVKELFARWLGILPGNIEVVSMSDLEDLPEPHDFYDHETEGL